MNKRQQQGFTLVEIAIVLIIIGLLLGGILKGQELITSARVRNIADQNSGIQAAYYGFVDRYRRVPGDWAADEASRAIGETVFLPTSAGNTNAGEIDNNFNSATAVWEQLTKAGFLSGGFQLPTSATAPTTRVNYANNAPSNAFGSPLVLTSNNAYTATGTTAAAAQLNLRLGNGISVEVARELDVKLDDGSPNTGSLRLTTTTTAADTPDGTVTANVACMASATGTAATALANMGEDATDIYNVTGGQTSCGQVFLY